MSDNEELKSCSACGAEVAAGAKFCSECGSARSPLEVLERVPNPLLEARDGDDKETSTAATDQLESGLHPRETFSGGYRDGGFRSRWRLALLALVLVLGVVSAAAAATGGFGFFGQAAKSSSKNLTYPETSYPLLDVSTPDPIAPPQESPSAQTEAASQDPGPASLSLCARLWDSSSQPTQVLGHQVMIFKYSTGQCGIAINNASFYYGTDGEMHRVGRVDVFAWLGDGTYQDVTTEASSSKIRALAGEAGGDGSGDNVNANIRYDGIGVNSCCGSHLVEVGVPSPSP